MLPGLSHNSALCSSFSGLIPPLFLLLNMVSLRYSQPESLVHNRVALLVPCRGMVGLAAILTACLVLVSLYYTRRKNSPSRLAEPSLTIKPLPTIEAREQAPWPWISYAQHLPEPHPLGLPDASAPQPFSYHAYQTPRPMFAPPALPLPLPAPLPTIRRRSHGPSPSSHAAAQPKTSAYVRRVSAPSFGDGNPKYLQGTVTMTTTPDQSFGWRRSQWSVAAT